MKVNYDLIAPYKRVGIFYGLISVVLAIGAFLCFFINKTAAGVFISILAYIFFGLGYCRILLMKNVYKYIVIINSGEMRIEKISGALAIPIKEVKDDINTLISARIFLELEQIYDESIQLKFLNKE